MNRILFLKCRGCRKVEDHTSAGLSMEIWPHLRRSSGWALKVVRLGGVEGSTPVTRIRVFFNRQISLRFTLPSLQSVGPVSTAVGK